MEEWFLNVQTEGTTMSQGSVSQGKVFFSGLLIGGLVGAGVMLLFAPKAGRKTREKIQHQVDEIRDEVIESIEDADEEVLATARHLTSDARRKVKGLQRRAKEMAHLK